MGTGSIAGRVRRLEARFYAKFPVPSVDEQIFRRLAAGEWQSAMKLLEPRERQLWEERQSIEDGGIGPNRMTHIDFTNLTQLRKTLDKSLGGLSWEVREKIAQQLLAADTEARRPLTRG
jgi:hypothetical protein